jgi:beta-glucosidase
MPKALTSLLLSTLLSGTVLAQSDSPEPSASPENTSAAQSAPAGVADEIIFNGSNGKPWRLYLGSSSNWMVPINGPVTTSRKSKVITVSWIDNVSDLDAIQAEWKGGLGQVYWQKESPEDYRELSELGAALSMVVRVDEKPKKSVQVKMDCGYPCAGTLNMSQLLKAVPVNQWFRVSLKLSCFEQSGANLANIIAPMVVATTDDFKLSISDVRITTNAPPESVVPCN